jgi:hypothetical protein
VLEPRARAVFTDRIVAAAQAAVARVARTGTRSITGAFAEGEYLKCLFAVAD